MCWGCRGGGPGLWKLKLAPQALLKARVTLRAWTPSRPLLARQCSCSMAAHPSDPQGPSSRSGPAPPQPQHWPPSVRSFRPPRRSAACCMPTATATQTCQTWSSPATRPLRAAKPHPSQPGLAQRPTVTDMCALLSPQLPPLPSVLSSAPVVSNVVSKFLMFCQFI